MATSFYATNLIPGNHVADALADLKVAVWADPGFTVVGIRTDAGLGGVFDAAFDFCASQTQTYGGQVNRFWLFVSRFGALRSVAARH